MKFYKLMFLLIFLTACNGGEEPVKTQKIFFDLHGYFEKEAERLQKQNPSVHKSVSQNREPQQKEVKIGDWKTEFELFKASDINKPAWRNSYRSIKNGNVTQYLATDNTLKTQRIQISVLANGAIKQISIFNKTSNTLYTSTENLHYFPDSLYSIIKKQDVQIIGKNSYSIFAKFKN